MNQIQLNRTVNLGTYKIDEIFIGLQNVEILLQIFKTREEIDDVFQKTKVIVSTESKFMHVNNNDGSIVVGQEHLQSSEKTILYLDIIHELVHVKQQRQGLDLYDKTYSYVDRPTEIEAYEIAVREAKRLGMSDNEIFDYLYVDWITSDEHKKLAKKMCVSF